MAGKILAGQIMETRQRSENCCNAIFKFSKIWRRMSDPLDEVLNQAEWLSILEGRYLMGIVGWIDKKFYKDYGNNWDDLLFRQDLKKYYKKLQDFGCWCWRWYCYTNAF